MDASSTRWLPNPGRGGNDDDEGPRAAEKTGGKTKTKTTTTTTTQGEKLLRLLCARLDVGTGGSVGAGAECRMSDAAISALALTWLDRVSVDPAMYAAYAAFLRRTARLCDPAIAPREMREMEDVRAAREAARRATAADAAAKEIASPPSARRARRSSASASAAAPAARDGEAFATPAPRPPPSATRTPSTRVAARKGRSVEPTSAAKTAAVDVPGAAEDDADAPRGRAKAEAVDDAPFRGSSDVDDDDEVDPRRRACSFLRRVALAHASKPPASLRARELFCVGDASVRYLRSKAQAAPRLCVEQAMDTPRAVLGCACCPTAGGPSATLPDTCCAYTLLQDMGDAANVHEWFRAFCETNEPATGVPRGGRTGRAKSTAGGRNGKGRGKKTARVGGGAVSSLLSLPAPGDDGGNDDDDGGDDDDEKQEKGTFHLERSRLWELQARFTRAVAEIEFLGVGRPVKRRKVEYMQRTAFPLDKLLGGDD